MGTPSTGPSTAGIIKLLAVKRRNPIDWNSPEGQKRRDDRRRDDLALRRKIDALMRKHGINKLEAARSRLYERDRLTRKRISEACDKLIKKIIVEGLTKANHAKAKKLLAD